MPFEEYDKRQIEEAHEKLQKVYEGNYGAPRMRKEISRLATIIRKLDYILKE